VSVSVLDALKKARQAASDPPPKKDPKPKKKSKKAGVPPTLAQTMLDLVSIVESAYHLREGRRGGGTVARMCRRVYAALGQAPPY